MADIAHVKLNTWDAGQFDTMKDQTLVSPNRASEKTER
jgi:hypothetical protein